MGQREMVQSFCMTWYLRVFLGVQIYQFQQNDDTTPVHSSALRQRHRRLRCDVLYHFLGVRTMGLSHLWDTSERFQHLHEQHVSELITFSTAPGNVFIPSNFVFTITINLVYEFWFCYICCDYNNALSSFLYLYNLILFVPGFR